MHWNISIISEIWQKAFQCYNILIFWSLLNVCLTERILAKAKNLRRGFCQSWRFCLSLVWERIFRALRVTAELGLSLPSLCNLLGPFRLFWCPDDILATKCQVRNLWILHKPTIGNQVWDWRSVILNHHLIHKESIFLHNKKHCQSPALVRTCSSPVQQP